MRRTSPRRWPLVVPPGREGCAPSREPHETPSRAGGLEPPCWRRLVGERRAVRARGIGFHRTITPPTMRSCAAAVLSVPMPDIRRARSEHRSRLGRGPKPSRLASGRQASNRWRHRQRSRRRPSTKSPHAALLASSRRCWPSRKKREAWLRRPRRVVSHPAAAGPSALSGTSHCWV